MKIETITSVRHDTDNLIIRDVPVSSTIVEISGYGLAVIDTGSPDNPDFIEELDQLGYTPADFKLVINTHLHTDHIGSNSLFSNARILISRQELDFENEFARILRESDNPLTVLNSMGRYIKESSHELARHLIALIKEYPTAALIGDRTQIEFFEDEPELPKSIVLLNVPGHSVDSRAVGLQGKIRRAVAAGDALYHRDLWRQDTLAAIHYNAWQFQQSAQRIARFPDIIIPGHDRVFDNLTRQYLPDDYLLI